MCKKRLLKQSEASQPVASPKPVQPSSKPRQKAVVAAKEQKPTPVAASRPQVASTADG